MDLKLIVACNKLGIIGNNNNIPWYVPEDLKYFKDITINNIVIMGRKTFDSLPNKILKDRLNIIITNNYLNYENIENKCIFTNMDNIMTILNNLNNNKKIFIIGGKEIYKLFLPICKTIYLTIINYDGDGDTVFPYDINIFNNKLIYNNIKTSELLISKNNNISYQYFIYELN